ncbi:MAG: hypothetical protein KDA60_17175 [Planctomycetales bacterium]|nr:hypothetical protein [Planctomycetales bacterium]
MVNQTAQSLLAEYAEHDDFTLDVAPGRSFSPKREQPSRARYATAARYSRKRSAGAPTGPRRRLRKG